MAFSMRWRFRVGYSILAAVAVAAGVAWSTLPTSQSLARMSSMTTLAVCALLVVVMAALHLYADVWPFDSADAVVSKIEQRVLHARRRLDVDVIVDGLDLLYSKSLAEDADAVLALSRILSCADSCLMRVALHSGDGRGMNSAQRDRLAAAAFSVCSGVCGGAALRGRMDIVPVGMLDRMTRVLAVVQHDRDAVQYGAMSIGALVDALQQHAVQTPSAPAAAALRVPDVEAALRTVLAAWKQHVGGADDSKEACLWCLWAVLHLISVDEVLLAEEEDETRMMSALAIREGAFDAMLHSLRQHIGDDKVCTVGVLLGALLAKQAPSAAAAVISTPACGDVMQLVINTHPRVERVQEVGGLLLAAHSRLQKTVLRPAARASAAEAEVD